MRRRRPGYGGACTNADTLPENVYAACWVEGFRAALRGAPGRSPLLYPPYAEAWHRGYETGRARRERE